MNTTKKRLDYFDMAKGFGAIFVLLGHLQGDEFFKFSKYILPMCEWIFSFHMPLFFIVSGMLMCHRNDIQKDTKTLILKRFKGIMIPYFWFSAFYFSVVVYALIFGSIEATTLYVNLWYVLGLFGMNVLWFLPALFLGESLFILIMKTSYNSKYSLKGGISAFVKIACLAIIGHIISYRLTLINFDSFILERVHELLLVILRPLCTIAFIGIGYIAYNYLFSEESVVSAKLNTLFKNKFESTKKSSLFIKKTAGFLFGLAIIIIGAYFVKINHGVDFRSMVFKNVFFYYLCSLCGSFGLITICKNIPKISIISFFGVNSLIFMATHNSKTILFYGLRLAMFANQYLTHARGYICYAIVVFVILLYVYVMTILINKFAPFIIGKPCPFPKKINNNN